MGKIGVPIGRGLCSLPKFLLTDLQRSDVRGYLLLSGGQVGKSLFQALYVSERANELILERLAIEVGLSGSLSRSRLPLSNRL